MYGSMALKLFFLLTPFFVVTMFLTLTEGMDRAAQRRVAVKTTVAVLTVSFTLYLFGQMIFDLFGITLNAFRVGAGCLLFLSAVDLARGQAKRPEGVGEDFAVVPLAVPITVGPATTGALLVMGAGLENVSQRLTGAASLATAVAAIGLLLWLAGWVERLLGPQGLAILSRLTGLVLAAISAQIVFTGVKGFLS